MCMGAIQLYGSVEAKGHQCSVSLPLHALEHQYVGEWYDSLLILPAECTEGCLHHGALKPVKRDGEVGVLCSCVPSCTSSLATL